MNLFRRAALASLLVVAPLAWSMDNENTALVKSFALGLFAAALLSALGFPALWRSVRPALPPQILLAAALAAAAVSPSPSFAWPAALAAASLGIVAAGAAGPGDPRRWSVTLAAAVLPPILLAGLQAAGADPTPWAAVAREHFHGRICSTLGNPNFLGAYLAGGLPFLWGAGIPGAILAGAGALVLVLTGSKGGLLGLAVAAHVYAAAARRAGHGGRALLVPGAALAAGLAVGLALAPSVVRGRLLPGDDATAPAANAAGGARNESVRFRALTWTQTLRMLRDAPFAGHGLGRFQVAYPRYRVPEIIRMFKQHSYMTDHPENLTLEIAAEGGVAGAGLWIWLLLEAARRLALRLRSVRPAERRLAASSAGGLAGLLATNSFGVDVHYGATAVLAACVYGAGVLRPERGAPAARPRRAAPAAAAAVAGLALAAAWCAAYASDAALARALAASTAASWDDAARWYGAARSWNPGNVMARYFGASAFLDRGRAEDLAAAERLFAGVRREAPDYVLLNYKEWLLYNRLGRRPEAARALSRQIELDPIAAVFYLERGRRAMDELRWEDARRDFETATEADPDDPSGWQYLGNFLVTRGRFRDALDVYGRGLARVPGSVDLHYNAAVAAWKLGNRPLARVHAEAVLRLQPGHPQARLILSRL